MIFFRDVLGVLCVGYLRSRLSTWSFLGATGLTVLSFFLNVRALQSNERALNFNLPSLQQYCSHTGAQQ